ncbi:hypothetical protein [Planktothrix pseudagardhii]|uniref:Uncharacterized protein n=1 Tax=Planktothrix pseudagardhii TaxID=132604 RepID=A0A9W4G2F4_9CYAN|nr:hypothetical protein [Planktothrix pseudagardhii]CAD5916794.1 hypothetical protein NO713_00400 [Planktothrix pseudagardhii]
MANLVKDKLISNSNQSLSLSSTEYPLYTRLKMSADLIYEFFLNRVQTDSPGAVLDSFEQLFFLPPVSPKTGD